MEYAVFSRSSHPPSSPLHRNYKTFIIVIIKRIRSTGWRVRYEWFKTTDSHSPQASVADPDPYVFGTGSRIRILLSSGKNSKKTLIPTCFATSF
jgi:hypothetical protein